MHTDTYFKCDKNELLEKLNEKGHKNISPKFKILDSASIKWLCQVSIKVSKCLFSMSGPISWTWNKLLRATFLGWRFEDLYVSVDQDVLSGPSPSPLWEPELCVYLKTQPEPGVSPLALILWPWLYQYLVQQHSWLLSTPFMNTQITAFLSGPLRRDALLLWLIMYQLINLLALVNGINYFKWLLIVHICIITKDKSG